MTAGVLGVFGVGAIGGSIGLRARRNGATVLGWDNHSAVLAEAREIGAIDEAVSSAAELAARVGTLVLAAHLHPTLAEIRRLSVSSSVAAELIVDVASVKSPVVCAVEGLRNFVATHPMAGSERSGPKAARAEMFEGRPWAYVPSGDAALDRRATTFIESMGAAPLAMTAEDHDRIVALTSHVPQVVAYAFAQLIREEPNAEALCGPVARELLRIAKMDPAMWQPIFNANSENIKTALEKLLVILSEARSAESKDSDVRSTERA